jgi:hypothetical protein
MGMIRHSDMGMTVPRIKVAGHTGARAGTPVWSSQRAWGCGAAPGV